MPLTTLASPRNGAVGTGTSVATSERASSSVSGGAGAGPWGDDWVLAIPDTVEPVTHLWAEAGDEPAAEAAADFVVCDALTNARLTPSWARWRSDDGAALAPYQAVLADTGRTGPRLPLRDQIELLETARAASPGTGLVLVELGHRSIAHIDGGRAPGAAERRRGYRDALRRHGLDRGARIIPGGLTEEDGAAAARALMAGPS